ncbi:EAL domain-containing protein [Neptuniibacter sp. QD34_54]|uniref:bifunctional diguanylate cyclase/phosphodiesterase n=1 Tax=Neptuniibacter sp. QD34_54 TaxID=3398208 RepID=UPI0039F5CEE6
MISKKIRQVFSDLSHSPLAQKTLLQMSIRLSVVITLAAIISYAHIFGILHDQVEDSLRVYITERGEKESQIFLNAQLNHRLFEEQFLKQWPERSKQAEPQDFDLLFEKRSDQTRRLSKEAFTGIHRPDGTISQHISAFIGTNAPNSNEFANKLQLSYQLIDRYADAFTQHYANLYVSMPENVNIVYWPNIPWGEQAESNLDVTIEEWVYISTPQNNPQRDHAWTGLYFDPTADEWMVSLVTPVDHNNKHLINVGHDILLNDLFDSVFNDKLSGTHNFVVRHDGRIIAHPDLTDALNRTKGILHANDSGNDSIANQVHAVLAHAQTQNQSTFILEPNSADALLAVTKIAGPDWYFVTVYPKSLLSSTALQTAYIVSIAGILSLLVELLILFFILKGQVLYPLGVFRRFSRAMRDSNFDAINDVKHSAIPKRKDEMGELATTMITMAEHIEQHQMLLTDEVNTKTRELSQAHEVLKLEARSREEITRLLQTIAKDVSGLQGLTYFETLGEFLSNTLDADMVIISKLSEDKESINALAAYIDKQKIDNLSYPLAGTPCETVIEEGSMVFNGNVQELYPEDEDLFKLDLHSYIGTPMYDAHGQVIGHLAVLKRKEFEQTGKTQLIIDSVTSRAASELIRNVHEQIINHQARTDSLTGLYNRAMFIDLMSQAIHSAARHERKLAVIFVDFDNFKLVNDQLGHSEGDKLLIEATNRLKQALRSEDILARFGGDEFIVLLPQIDNSQSIETVTRHMQKLLAKDVQLDTTSLTISCSMGVAIYPEDGTTTDTLINHADTAMYRAKDLGRNNVQFFTEDMNVRMELQRELEHDLRLAISKQEFQLFYQPIINIRSGEVAKIEALIRWQHPQRGLVSPDQFIPFAEQSGQIISISEFVLKQACSDLPKLKQHFKSLERLSINCSARLFQNKSWVQDISETLAAHSITCQDIELEVTESLFMDSHDQSVIQTLNDIHNLGISISLDDFGTGYSSLSYLKRMPVDCLKIDKSFIRDVLTQPEEKRLVAGIIDLAKNFNLEVVTEGIETREQYQLLAEMGCDLVQGYYFFKPTPLDQLLTGNVEKK